MAPEAAAFNRRLNFGHSAWLGRLALGRVAQAVAHGFQALDARIDFIRFRQQQLAVDSGLSFGIEHRSDIVQRQSGRLAECD